MSLSNKQLKFINSLQLKKYRQQHRAFLVEGAKNVLELLAGPLPIEVVCCTPAFALQHEAALRGHEVYEMGEEQLSRLGTLENNNAALAVAQMPEQTELRPPFNNYIIALDRVRDPGNLGTIIRIADWYGINQIICSHQTAELYNPKVIGASMGSYLRAQVWYDDLEKLLPRLGLPVYAAVLEGENLHQLQFEPNAGVLLVGNESEGISPALIEMASHRVTIPGFGQAESLNVAIATAVICDNLRRQQPR